MSIQDVPGLLDKLANLFEGAAAEERIMDVLRPMLPFWRLTEVYNLLHDELDKAYERGRTRGRKEGQ